MNRPKVPEELVLQAFEDIKKAMIKAISKHGDGSFLSIHEILGTITEEYHELVEATHKNDVLQFIRELEDLAVISIFALACFKTPLKIWFDRS